MEKGVAFHLYRIEFPSPLYQVWLKLEQQRRTNEKFQSENSHVVWCIYNWFDQCGGIKPSVYTTLRTELLFSDQGKWNVLSH